jgi:tetrapyrrole methylase family protein/MazG family protein
MATHAGALFEELLQVMRRLRAQGGCPWDREQTRDSLKPFLVEETYEVLEALDEGSPSALREELGDLLFQVVFHAHIAQEFNEFSIADVLQQLIDKMIRRHPHVFGDRSVRSASEALAQWESIKHAEGTRDGQHRSVLDGVPKTLPALLRAERIQAKASRVGFDWNAPEAAWKKVEEELHEIQEALHRDDRAKASEEFGDLLFAVVNVARLLRISAEGTLQQAVEKFALRFKRIERMAVEEGRTLHSCSLEELDRFWEAVKAQELKETERQ